VIVWLAAIINVSSSLGYLLPAIIGLESMGIPSPGETALVLAAVLASQGQLSIWLVIPIAIVSAIAGDNLGYLLGRRLGRDVLAGPGPFQERRVGVIAAGDKFFDKHGPKAVFIGRWIALVRFAVAWLAGINRMRFRLFFFYNAAGAITWALTFGLLGYFGGKAIVHILEQVGVGAAIALGVIGVGAFVYFKARERRRARAAIEQATAPPTGPGTALESDGTASGAGHAGPPRRRPQA
jgi:membrane protein DedA with SNARE-associated domain